MNWRYYLNKIARKIKGKELIKRRRRDGRIQYYWRKVRNK